MFKLGKQTSRSITIGAMKKKRTVWEKCSYTWIIEGFSTLGHDVEYVIISPEFRASDNSKCIWKLNLYPTGWGPGQNDYIGLFLRLVSSSKDNVFTKFSLSIRDSNDQVICENKGEQVVQRNPHYGFPKFEERKILMSKIVDDVVKVHAEICSLIDELDCFHEIDSDSNFPEIKLAEDLLSMLNNPKFSDVVLVAENEEIEAHRSILSARSPVFAAMFEHDFIERYTSKVMISDFSITTLRNFVQFIYTCRIDIPDVHMGMDLLRAAAKYAMEDLKVICGQYLTSNFSLSNVEEILLAADMFCYPELKENAMNYIINNLVYFCRLEHYERIEVAKPRLLTEILVNMSGRLYVQVNKL